jgi:hypothetical protein
MDCQKFWGLSANQMQDWRDLRSVTLANICRRYADF